MCIFLTASGNFSTFQRDFRPVLPTSGIILVHIHAARCPVWGISVHGCHTSATDIAGSRTWRLWGSRGRRCWLGTGRCRGSVRAAGEWWTHSARLWNWTCAQQTQPEHWATSLFDLTFAEPIRWAKVRSKYQLKPKSEVISLSESLTCKSMV